MIERIMARLNSFIRNRNPKSFEDGERVALIKSILEMEPVSRQEAREIFKLIQDNTQVISISCCKGSVSSDERKALGECFKAILAQNKS